MLAEDGQGKIVDHCDGRNLTRQLTANPTQTQMLVLPVPEWAE
jgi:hypothetical protein